MTSNDRKLFHVSMTLDIDMMVLAENETQARTSAKDNWHDEVLNASLEPSHTYAREVLDRNQAKHWGNDEDLDGCSPYGVAGEKYEHGCSSPQLTISEYLEALSGTPAKPE